MPDDRSQPTDRAGLVARLRQKARHCRSGSKDAEANGSSASADALRREARDLDDAADLIEVIDNA